ncbi:hypothetical protein T06_14406 [Trichinella sp. T6]|nr:hypothetical protein T06_14406 [Trichinella sp. T6]
MHTASSKPVARSGGAELHKTRTRYCVGTAVNLRITWRRLPIPPSSQGVTYTSLTLYWSKTALRTLWMSRSRGKRALSCMKAPWFAHCQTRRNARDENQQWSTDA